MIDEYHFGSITVDNKAYNHDLILLPDKILNWWRKDGHVMAPEDFKELSWDFDVLVLGTGASGQCDVPEETISYIKENGVELKMAQSKEATEIYNQLLDEGRKVVGAFHLTC